MSSFERTQPSRRAQPALDELQPVQVYRRKDWKSPKQKRTGRFWFGFLFVLFSVYFLAPLRTNFLILGVDDTLGRGDLGRTDTMILTTVVPFRPYVGLLSIPRDLWVDVPNVGEQRINTAFFFAEANQAGTGAPAAVGAVRQNFGITLHYYLVLHMSGMIDFVNTLGGVDIVLDEPLGGLSAGPHHLNGDQALAFARERYSSDDFSRMRQGQIVLLASFREAIRPPNWIRLPNALWSLAQVADTNIPSWQWPRLGFAFLRALVFGVDTRTITPEMVVPFQTSGGAQVLAPDWEAINPVLMEMFGE